MHRGRVVDGGEGGGVKERDRERERDTERERERRGGREVLGRERGGGARKEVGRLTGRLADRNTDSRTCEDKRAGRKKENTNVGGIVRASNTNTNKHDLYFEQTSK